MLRKAGLPPGGVARRPAAIQAPTPFPEPSKSTAIRPETTLSTTPNSENLASMTITMASLTSRTTTKSRTSSKAMTRPSKAMTRLGKPGSSAPRNRRRRSAGRNIASARLVHRQPAAVARRTHPARLSRPAAARSALANSPLPDALCRRAAAAGARRIPRTRPPGRREHRQQDTIAENTEDEYDEHRTFGEHLRTISRVLAAAGLS